MATPPSNLSADSPSASLLASGAQPKDFVPVPDTPAGARDRIIKLAVYAFGIAWGLFGLLAFVFSLICFGYSGSILEKLVGVVLAILFGPFYFIYYFASGSYCKALPPTIF